MHSTISRRVFLRFSGFLAAFALPLPGCDKRSGSAPSKDQTMPVPGASSGLVLLDDDVGPFLYGDPVILCGAVVKGKPTFKMLGNFGTLSVRPPRPIVYISSDAKDYTNLGIRENKEFSVCFPHVGILAKADYCGVFSGHKVDKSKIFDVQYGALKNAPLIISCHVCFACKVVQQTNVNDMDVFYAEIIEKYASPACLKDGRPDPEKIKAIAFGPGNAYRAIDTVVGTPWSEYKKAEGITSHGPA